MIYISTGGFGDLVFDDVIYRLNQFGLTSFELSGGRYTKDLSDKLVNASRSNTLAIHNYFPPHKRPFVFNLASLNDETANFSIDHAKAAIDYAHLIGSKFYSFHAGYLIDPKVDELGRRINRQTLNCRVSSLDIFIDRVNSLSRYAFEKGIKLMIENNVLSHTNFVEFQESPLMMVEIDETNEILNRTDNNVGLLIDVAHLKVSANTLGYSAVEFMQEFNSRVSGYHLSDNEGLSDDNNPFCEDSWFWPYLDKNLDYYSIEVYQSDGHVLKSQFDLARSQLS